MEVNMSVHKFRVIIEQDEDGMLVATVPELKGCHTQAKTMDVLLARIRKAVELYLDYLGEKGREAGKMSFVGLQEIEVKA